MRRDERKCPVLTAAYVPLEPESAAVFSEVDGVGPDDPSTGRVPNYLRALAATHPAAVRPLARLFDAVLYGGSLPAKTKAAMGLLIARENGSDYLAAHMTRLLMAAERGRALLRSLATDQIREKERAALRYAVALTRATAGVSDAEFARTRTFYTDSRLVELTIVTGFFNHLARFCQGAGLTLELWVKNPPNALPAAAREKEDAARVALASDAEIQMAVKLANSSPEPARELESAILNSQRVMLRAPDLDEAWSSYRQAVLQETTLSGETLLQISFAVSLANGCRYCLLHHVVGLRRLGVDPARLRALPTDDAVLAPAERAAVTFARKLTRKPGAIRRADFEALRAELGGDGEAMDALLQTCAVSFMNRFTDGLRLPCEGEAIRVYQEVYGQGAYHDFPPGGKTQGAAR